MDTFWSVLGLLATGIAAGGAIGSWRPARHSSAAATAVAKIEQDRRHIELTPQFERNCRVTYGDGAMLRLAFTGPPGLDHLDAVAIRDDKHDREPIARVAPRPRRSLRSSGVRTDSYPTLTEQIGSAALSRPYF